MTLTPGVVDRLMRKALDNAVAQIQAALDAALAQISSLEGVAQTADTQIVDSQDDRAALHALVDWLNSRLVTIETQLGITPPPSPTS